MKQIQQVALAAMLTSGSAVVTAAPIIIDFDTDGLGAAIAANTTITTQYANLGVLFAGIEDGAAVDINAAPDPDGVAAPSPPNVMSNCSDASAGCPGNRADILRITFDGLVASDISLQLDSLGGSSITFNLYDAADVLLETLSVTSGASAFVPVAFTAANVSRIDGLQPSDGWAWAFDDLTFTATSTVPEPATLALLGLGLVGVGWSRRKAAA